MEEKIYNPDKKEYLPPVLIEYGTVDSITKGGGAGPFSDSFSPPDFAFSNVNG